MRAVVVLVLVIVALLPGVALAQDATPACTASEMRANKLAPHAIDGGLYFAGKPGTFVTEPFVLPQGIVLVTGAMRAPTNGKTHVQIHQTDGGSGATYNTVPIYGKGPFNGTVVVTMKQEREVFLAIEATGAWELTLEF